MKNSKLVLLTFFTIKKFFKQAENFGIFSNSPFQVFRNFQEMIKSCLNESTLNTIFIRNDFNGFLGELNKTN